MMTNSLATLPLQKLKRAVGIREQIEALTQELNQLLGTHAYLEINGAIHDKRPGLTMEGRARIAAAQRLRWSKYNAARGIRPKTTAPRSQRLSTEGRAKVSAAVKARWIRYRAEKIAELQAK